MIFTYYFSYTCIQGRKAISMIVVRGIIDIIKKRKIWGISERIDLGAPRDRLRSEHVR